MSGNCNSRVPAEVFGKDKKPLVRSKKFCFLPEELYMVGNGLQRKRTSMALVFLMLLKHYFVVYELLDAFK